MGKSKSSKCGRGDVGVGVKRPSEPNPFAEYEAMTCQSCQQTTHDVDRDSPPEDPKYLQWYRLTKKTITKKGTKGKNTSLSRECRTERNATSATTHDGLTSLQNGIRKLSTTSERRIPTSTKSSLPSGGNGVAKLATTTSSVLTSCMRFRKKTVETNKTYIEGSFIPLESWAERRHIKYKNLEELREIIKTKHQDVNIETDMEGVEGIEVWDQEAGSYRIQRSRDEIIAKQKN